MLKYVLDIDYNKNGIDIIIIDYLLFVMKMVPTSAVYLVSLVKALLSIKVCLVLPNSKF